ncbi:cytochrome b, partial [Pseudorhodobacter sp. MZDSW-24AT]|uniref:cytochrome b n=1 Tax=Pseudorhodobacter sp. MZDSW-24AT TaxID=2052957 RepID=UPI000CBE95CE
MPARNSPVSYGKVARLFHWTTASLILIAIPLGIIANRLPYDTAEALARKAQLFSLHKTLGVVVFFVALGRILWALAQPHPVPLHPERRLELALARLVHWMLYISLVAVPLTGWVHHAAVTGFAPIWWPFGQTLPFVPQSESVAQIAVGLHWVFTKLMIAAILLHIAGALKHHILDRDDTLRRMTRGTRAPAVARAAPPARLP